MPQEGVLNDCVCMCVIENCNFQKFNDFFLQKKFLPLLKGRCKNERLSRIFVIYNYREDKVDMTHEAL